MRECAGTLETGTDWTFYTGRQEIFNLAFNQVLHVYTPDIPTETAAEKYPSPHHYRHLKDTWSPELFVVFTTGVGCIRCPLVCRKVWSSLLSLFPESPYPKAVLCIIPSFPYDTRPVVCGAEGKGMDLG